MARPHNTAHISAVFATLGRNIPRPSEQRWKVVSEDGRVLATGADLKGLRRFADMVGGTCQPLEVVS